MKRNIYSTFFTIILLFSVLNSSSCSSRDETVSCFPSAPINLVLNLNLPAYFTLQNVGGWMYINEQQSGTRGLIIARTTNGFKVYDRNAPHICPDSDTTLSVENDIKIICPKDGAEWITITEKKKKIAQVSPKTYLYSYDTNTKILSVYY